jgi:lipopolysaccharide export system permease protein
MRIITRYILTESIKSFLLAVCVLTPLLMLGGVVREALHRGLPLEQALQLVPYILPEQLRYTIPMTLLLATTTFFARMAGSNEVVALKSSGISPWSLIWPVLVFAFFVSLVTVWLNDVAVSWGRQGIARVMIDAAEEIIYSKLRTDRTFTAPGGQFSIMVEEVRDKKLMHPTFTLKDPPTTVIAQQAELSSDPSHEILQIKLHNLEAGTGDRRLHFPDEFTYDIPLKHVSSGGSRIGHPSNLALQIIPDEIGKTNHNLETFHRQLATKAAFAYCSGDFEQLIDPTWATREKTESIMEERLRRLKTEMPRRWSAGFSCLFFVWIGAPLAIWMRKRDVFASFFSVFLPILVIYYPLLILGMEGAKNGTLPPWSVWTGNAILAVLGFWILRKTIRY